MNGGSPVGGAERIRKAADVNVQAVKGVDYFVAASLADLVRDNLATDLLKAQYDALTAAAGANA